MRIWPWVLGLGAAAAVGVGVAMAAAPGARQTIGGMTWDLKHCTVVDIDLDVLASTWSSTALAEIVIEQEIRTGRGLMIAVFREVAPEECKAGIGSGPEWDKLDELFGDEYQAIVDAVWAEEEGTVQVLAFDPSDLIVESAAQLRGGE